MKNNLLRKYVVAILLVLLQVTIGILAGANTETVYVTKSGKKYHRDGCNSLRSSKIPMDLEKATARYSPCSKCRPPVIGSSKDGSPRSEPPRSDKDGNKYESKKSGQCQATTKKGTQCRRKAQAGSQYCYQHGG